MKGLTKDKAKVTWGSESREFTKAQLEGGINLAAEFSRTPFDAAFGDVLNAVGAKQSLETSMIKNVVSPFRSFAGDAKSDPEFAKALQTIKTKLVEKQAASDADVRKRLKPVTHTITVEAL